METFNCKDDVPTIVQDGRLRILLSERQRRLIEDWCKKKRRIERRRKYQEWFRTLVRPK